MSGGGGGGQEGPPPPSANSGGQFLLQLLQKPHQSQTAPSENPTFLLHSHQNHLDPAVAVVGPSVHFPPWQSNGQDSHPPLPQWLSNQTSNNHNHSHLLPGFPPNPWTLPGLSPPPTSDFPGKHPILPDELYRLGLLGNPSITGNSSHQHQQHLHQLHQQQRQQQQQQEEKSMMMFGSLPCDLRNREGLQNQNSSVDRLSLESQLWLQRDREVFGLNGRPNFDEIRPNFSQNRELDHQIMNSQSHPGNNNLFHDQGRGVGSGKGYGRQQHFERSHPVLEPRRDPPGCAKKEGRVNGELNNGRPYQVHEDGDGILRRQSNGNVGIQGGLSRQVDHPGPPQGSKLHSVPASDIEESLAKLHRGVVEVYGNSGLVRQENKRRDQRIGGREENDLAEKFMGSLALKDRYEKKNDMRRQDNNSNDKQSRGLWVPPQRMRNNRKEIECRNDINRLNSPLLDIFESLVPPEEEKAKQKQLLTSLEKLVVKEWPRAQLYLYGSCANQFGVLKSDIDVCLAIEDNDINKSELLLKLAEILESDNLQNVQALTRARVPIVKLMDPVTGLSCDICVNNVLAVVNTKLLRDYAQIDGRLRQLAFIVKHWAKSRGVNETYRGTLSSYAYVLMCIHFLQQRKPAILPCLQEMDTTYSVTVDDIQCAYFDKVENLREFGAGNKETIAQLVWGFFDYWAHRHDYMNAVISVRTGSILSKRAKDWTRRIGNDRHLICIEDPFETSHDLGRVVDKFTIKTLREEFERAAHIMQYDPNPCVTLFEEYVPN